ncbi:MAG: hypothetical protein AB7I38_06510 [Dehalococcoidia bacterium]
MQTSTRARALAVSAVFLGATLLSIAAFAARGARAGDGFDFLRWEVAAFPNKWIDRLGAPLRDDPDPDDALRRYFALDDRNSEEGRALENEVESVIEGRVDAVLRDLGLGWPFLPLGVWPPVDGELAGSPRILVVSPRDRIARLDTDTLRPDLTREEAEALEQAVEERHEDRSALVVGTGGLSLFPAVISNRDGYEGTVDTVAHEWTHHYLSVFPLGREYFRSDDTRTINETVADLVGSEVARIVLERWPLEPTAPATPTRAPTATASPPAAPALDFDATMRDLRAEVDALLAAGRIEEAERRMEEVRVQLNDGGYAVRRINQAYFAWYGTYAARGDSIDPLGGQLRDLRDRSGSLGRFLETVRDATSRDEVAALLASLSE